MSGPVIDPRLEITISNRWEDVDLVMKIVHDVYVTVGYAKPRGSGRRLIPTYWNPDALFIIGRWEGGVGAVAVLVPDGPFGLPSERVYGEEIQDMRDEGLGVWEYTSLCVLDEYRHMYRHFFGGLFGAGYRAIVAAGGATHVCLISVPPEQERSYTAMLDFERVGDARPLYGAPAVLLKVPIDTVAGTLESGSRRLHQQLKPAFLGEETDWLVDRRLDLPNWPTEPLLELIDEQRGLAGLPDQVAHLVRHHPGVASQLFPVPVSRRQGVAEPAESSR